MKNLKLATKIGIIVIIILTIGLVILWRSTDSRVSRVMKDEIMDKMDDAIATREQIIDQYIASTESYMVGYAQEPSLREVLKHPNDKTAFNAGQSYTKSYGNQNKNLENIYVGSYESKVLVSFVEGPIGKVLREGDSLKALQDSVFGTEGVFNAGIMLSPSTNQQVVSMYYPLFENGKPLGYVGAAVSAGELKETLNKLSEEEANKTDYMLLDAANGTYIFCADEEKIGTEIAEENISKIVERAKDETNKETSFEYNENGKEMLAVYRYMPEKNWVLVIQEDKGVAYAPVDRMSVMLLIMCAVILVVISVCVWIVGRLIARDIVKVAKVIQEIGTLDLTLRYNLNTYSSRRDEVGMIAKATIHLTDEVAETVKLIKEKSEALLHTSEELHSGSNVTRDSAESIDKAIGEIAKSTVQQANDTQQAVGSVLHIGETIENTMSETEVLSGHADSIQKTSEEMRGTVRELSRVNKDTENVLDEISKQTMSTHDSAMKIRDAAQMITSIAEETNMLSLNASIEAARAGEQGKGFAVVASQIQKLAEQSNDSAKQIDSIINVLLKDSNNAVQTMHKMMDIMREQSEQLTHTEEQFEEIYQTVEVTKQGVATISETVRGMDEERLMVVGVVEKLLEIASSNATGTERIQASTETLDSMVKNVSDVSNELIDVSNNIEQSVSGFTV